MRTAATTAAAAAVSAFAVAVIVQAGALGTESADAAPRTAMAPVSAVSVFDSGPVAGQPGPAPVASPPASEKVKKPAKAKSTKKAPAKKAKAPKKTTRPRA